MHRTATLLLVLAVAGCRQSPTGTEATRVSLAVLGDDVVYAAADGAAADPLRVVALHPGTGAVQRDVEITWHVSQGAGGVSPQTSRTDAYGVATAMPLPAGEGTYRVTATAALMVGAQPSIEVRVVPRPSLTQIQPASFAAGSEITITGANFSTTASQNAVWFDGVRGRVLTASATELLVEVPRCLPARQVAVRVGLGAVQSAVHNATSTGGTLVDLALAPGEVHVATDASALACTRISGSTNAQYLVTVHNASGAFRPRRAFELRSLTSEPLATATMLGRAPLTSSFAHDWELQLRRRERELGARAQLDATAELQVAPAAALGERRQFNVVDRNNRFVQVNAEVRHISTRAVLYVDVDALTAFTSNDLQSLGAVFDDPIYSTVTGVFGEPSDIDGNQRVIILFTPRVNALTPRNQGNSYIAGYFYGCDLVSRSACSGSNSGEIFYSIVPDASGTWSEPRSHASVMNAVPPVIAHEFQHMIHFARRGFSTDVLWLSEGLAHTAEELVADVFTARGQHATASVFRIGNHQRTQLYLIDPGATGMTSDESPGTLEMRGAAWLFLKYLRGHHGGNDLLRRMTSSTRTGAANVAHETGQPWNRLVTDFGVAVYADGAPMLQGPLESRYRFTGFDLRTAMAQLSGGYLLQPTVSSWSDFGFVSELPSSAHQHFLFSAGNGAGAEQPLSLVLAGYRGAPLSAQDSVTLSIVRLR